MEDKKDMLREQEAAKTASANSVVDTTPKTEAEDDEEEESLVMISVNKDLDRQSSGIQVMPEVSLEYACVLASKATKQPIEFFTGLSPKIAIKVKNRVMGFLFGAE